MNSEIFFTIVLAVGCLAIGYFINYLTAKITMQERIAAQLGVPEFFNYMKNIDDFLKKDDTRTILKTIQNIKIEDLSDFNSINRGIEERLSKFSTELNTISRLIETQVFNEVNGKIHRYIEDNAMFIRRLDEAKESKKYLAKNMLNTPIMERILQNRETIFIESGSTFAYFILPLIDYVKNMEENINEHQSFRNNPLTICTNNVIIYIILLFEEFFSPYLLPGKPTNQYAATFGDPKKNDRFNKEKTKSFFVDHNVTTILSTASFLDLTYGPHVSSYPNWQMKRFLNEYSIEKKCNNIFVITSEKINNHVSENQVQQNCKMIFNEEEGESLSCEDLSEDQLLRIKENFRNHLKQDHHYIITASTDSGVCSHQANKFQKNHQDIQHKWTIKIEQGVLAVLFKDKLLK